MVALKLGAVLLFVLRFCASQSDGTCDSEDQTCSSALQVLDDELRETAELIRLQTIKVGLLESLRAEVLADSSSLTAERVKLLDSLALASSVNDILAAVSPASTDGQQDSSAMIKSDIGMGFGDFFAARGSYGSEGMIVSAGLLPIRLRGVEARKATMSGQPDVIVLVFVAHADGTLLVLDLQGLLLLSYQTGHNAPLLKMAVGNSYEPIVVTHAIDGTVYTHSLIVFHNDVLLAGPRGRKLQQQPAVPGGGIEPNDAAQFTGISVIVEIESQFPTLDNAPVDIELYTMRRTTFVLTGDSTGEIRMFRRNGTEYGAMTATLGRDGPPAAISALQCVNHNLAVAVGQDIVFFSVQRKTMSNAMCRGVTGQHIVSIKYDVLVPAILYAATDSGEVLVFNLRARMPTSGKGSSKTGGRVGCRLVNKISTQATAAKAGGQDAVKAQADGRKLPTAVATLRGYVVTSVSGVLVVHNTTGISGGVPRYLFTYVFPGAGKETAKDSTSGSWIFSSHSSDSDELQKPPLPALLITGSLGEGRQASELLLLAPKDTKQYGASSGSKMSSYQLTTFESLLPFNPPTTDIGWVRSPMIIGGAVIIFAYQFFRNRRGGGGGGRCK